MTREGTSAADIQRWADLIATFVTVDDESFAAAAQGFNEAYEALLKAVARLDARFSFDREGRPAAIAAVRAALPAIEQELFDAIVEDCECERAAVEEALFQVVRAYGRRLRSNG